MLAALLWAEARLRSSPPTGDILSFEKLNLMKRARPLVWHLATT